MVANQKKNIVFILSYILGNKRISDFVRNVAESSDNINQTFVTFDDYELVDVRRKSNYLAKNHTYIVSKLINRQLNKIDGPIDGFFITTIQPLLLLMKKYSHVPKVCMFDGTSMSDLRMYNNWSNSPILKKLPNAIYKHSFKSVIQFLPHSQWAAKSLIKDYGVEEDKIKVSYLFSQFQEFRKRLIDNDSADLKLLFVGNDLERKGIIDFIPIFVKELSGSCQLTIVTKDKFHFTHDKITFIRGIDHSKLDQLIDIYSAADLFIFPSGFDMSPHVFIEAMFLSLPIVAFNISSFSEVIKNGENGYLVDYDQNRWSAFVEKINTISNNKEQLESMGASGLEAATKMFNKERFLEDVRQSIQLLSC